jgi:hypothetical protein
VRITVVHFVTCNLYLSGQLVKFVLKSLIKNDRHFMEVIHLLQTRVSVHDRMLGKDSVRYAGTVKRCIPFYNTHTFRLHSLLYLNALGSLLADARIYFCMVHLTRASVALSIYSIRS